MKRLIVPGHTLPNEGVVFGGGLYGGTHIYHAYATCSCGAQSPEKLTVHGRRKWHRIHKSEILEQQDREKNKEAGRLRKLIQ